MAGSSSKSDPEALVQVMRQIPSAVTIITAGNGSRSRGVTIGSFTSLSMDPPLVSFNLARESQMHTIMESAQSFVVHIPDSKQQDLCNRFAMSDLEDEEQFKDVEVSRVISGAPVLKGMIAEIYCLVDRKITAGDHTIIIGEIREIHHHRTDSAMVYLDGAYRNLSL